MTDAELIAHDCTRVVRGCATDEQYQELTRRIIAALAAQAQEIEQLEKERDPPPVEYLFFYIFVSLALVAIFPRNFPLNEPSTTAEIIHIATHHRHPLFHSLPPF
jgi:hypothetical protein